MSKAIIIINPATGTEWKFGSLTEVCKELDITYELFRYSLRKTHRIYSYEIYFEDDYLQLKARRQEQEERRADLYNIFVTENMFIYCKNSEWEVQADE